MARRIHALLIGINNYLHIPKLGGCLNDVLKMESFLRSLEPKFEVNIYVLPEDDANRHGILEAFNNHLINNSKIQVGDPIVFFFAGHGNTVKAPAEWGNSGTSEIICPRDQCHSELGSEDGQGIPARTINELLRRLAKQKGSNIIAIFDSCHSGTISRVNRTRTYADPDAITNPGLDHHIWQYASRGADKVPDSFMYDVQEMPHVTLAACRRDQVASEITFDGNMHGCFTHALLSTLTKDGIEIQYSSLIKKLEISPSQTPQCGGSNSDKYIFDATEFTPLFSLLPIEDQKGKYTVEAGTVHGVTDGTEFSVYSSARPSSSPGMGTLVCEYADHIFSILTHKEGETFDVGSGAGAVISDWKRDTMKVYCEDGFAIQPSQHWAPVDDEKKANVVVRCVSDGVFLKHRDSILMEMTETSQNVERFLSVSMQSLSDTLDHISQFRYHLLRGISENLKSDDELIQMKLHRLTPPDNRGRRKFAEMRSNFTENPHVEVTASETERYALEIINCSKYGLFPYIFYFDLADYSVQSWYYPFSPTMDCPLPGEKTITVGLGGGTGGGDPIRFTVDTEAKFEKGYLKIFLSSAYIEMKHIIQAPLQMDFPRPVDLRKPTTRTGKAIPDESPIWDMFIRGVTIMQP